MMGAPKFPNVPAIELLWRGYLNTSLPQFQHAVDMTLTNMCQGGIYDHLGGGFARYSVDERWLVPHFEKMLYDNAQMIDILSSVWLQTRNPTYKSRVEETVGWALREMLVEGGALRLVDRCGLRRRGRQVLRLERRRDRLGAGQGRRRCSSKSTTCARKAIGKAAASCIACARRCRCRPCRKAS